ncbi:hypothetical protein N1F78_10770 [Seonamhaeicola sp. MEBiC1930]|uniref:hypothetical protein n=1 Tax=Seonamhaeicola sp. MEBiC01930 TaxID=2976768 RepID=UPI003243EC5D
MIKFFRKIRQKLLSENKFSKYILYAIGEIVLVVIGIMIALQIDNWNQERQQEKELDGLKQSISSAIQSDIKFLKLIKKGRKNIGSNADSIFNYLIHRTKSKLVFNDYAYVTNTFQNLKNVIYYQPNKSAFESLKNSIYLSKLQGTDIELLLNSYYASAERIVKKEENYNKSLNIDFQEWYNKYRYNSAYIMNSWDYDTESPEFQNEFINILLDEKTQKLLSNSFEEEDMLDLYNQQIKLGNKYVEMVENNEVNFDDETKIEFSGTFYTYDEVDVLNILVNGKVPSDFNVLYANSSNKVFRGIEYSDKDMIITYPENKFDWCSPYFSIQALNGRVTEMDFTKYKKLSLVMKGAVGGEQFNITMKDKYDPTDGTESRVEITLTNTWETYEIPLSNFITADMNIINTPMAFIFVDNKGITIHVKSIQFN